jgi:hypothetical protein
MSTALASETNGAPPKPTSPSPRPPPTALAPIASLLLGAPTAAPAHHATASAAVTGAGLDHAINSFAQSPAAQRLAHGGRGGGTGLASSVEGGGNAASEREHDALALSSILTPDARYASPQKGMQESRLVEKLREELEALRTARCGS